MSRFADLIGHALAAAVLKKAIREGMVAHAYLFAGPQGIGKTMAALAFAASLNCDSRTREGDACGACDSCRMTEARRHPDVQIISPEGAQTKIEQMRVMRRSANFAPVAGRWKVAIIERAETLNEAAANSILKILEEPPPYLVIILLSRNPALILPTIRSRCLYVRFSSAHADELTAALTQRFGASGEEAGFLASYSDGRPGIAISLLGNEEFFEWRRRIVELATAISSADLRYALRLSEDLQNLAREDDKGRTQRAAMREALDALIVWYRDLLSLSIRGESAHLINSDLVERLSSVRSDPGRTSAAIETLLWARRAIEGNANIQLVSDVTMMRLVNRARSS